MLSVVLLQKNVNKIRNADTYNHSNYVIIIAVNVLKIAPLTSISIIVRKIRSRFNPYINIIKQAASDMFLGV